MNQISDLHPGKLKRKAKKSPNTSVVDIPAISTQAPVGNLLGDVIIDQDGAKDSSVQLILPSVSSETPQETASDLQPDIDISNDDINLSKLAASTSPLDLLRADKSASLSDLPSASQEIRDIRQDAPIPLRLQKKSKSAHIPTAETPVSVQAETSRANELFVETRDFHQKCVDTLTKLQDANVQNEKRYALYLTVVFIILAIVTVVGVIIGSNLKYNAKLNDLKFKHEQYTNMVNAKNTCDLEFEKEKNGSMAAYEVYQKIELGFYEEAIDKFNEVRDQLTHPAETALLTEKIDDVRWKLAENAYHDGVMLYNAANYEQARDAFFKSQSYKENTAYTPRLHFYIAMSLYQLGDFEGAKRYFSLLSSADLSADMDALTRYYRGICAEKLGNYAEAYEQFDQFLKKYRYHKLADDASKHRSKVESGKK